MQRNSKRHFIKQIKSLTNDSIENIRRSYPYLNPHYFSLIEFSARFLAENNRFKLISDLKTEWRKVRRNRNYVANEFAYRAHQTNISNAHHWKELNRLNSTGRTSTKLFYERVLIRSELMKFKLCMRYKLISSAEFRHEISEIQNLTAERLI